MSSVSLSGLLLLLLLLELGLPVPLLLCRRPGNVGAGLRGTTAISCFFRIGLRTVTEILSSLLRTVSPTNFSNQLTNLLASNILLVP